MSEMKWVEVTAADDLWEGDVVDFEVDGDQVMLAHLAGGEIKAYQSMCPHQEILLTHGDFDVDNCELTCTGHSWKFDLRDGKGTNPVGSQLYEYKVKIVDDKIQIGILQDGERHCCRFSAASEESQ